MAGASKKITPFDFLNSINHSKKDMYLGNDNAYIPYMINRSLSYFNDTVLMANEMNRYHHLDGELQYQFLLNIVRPRKRFSKWIKPEANDNIDAVKKYYGYSDEKARQVLPLLTTEQIKTINKKVHTGGRK